MRKLLEEARYGASVPTPRDYVLNMHWTPPQPADEFTFRPIQKHAPMKERSRRPLVGACTIWVTPWQSSRARASIHVDQGAQHRTRLDTPQPHHVILSASRDSFSVNEAKASGPSVSTPGASERTVPESKTQTRSIRG